MTQSRWQVWLVFAILLVTLPAVAQVTDCTGQPDGTVCVDDGVDPCMLPGCENEACNQNFEPASPGTPCPDTDDNVCTIPSCRPSGECGQDRARAEAGTPCPDTDGQMNTHAACDGDRTCDQNFTVDATSGVPALSTAGLAGLAGMLIALGFWRVRRLR